MIENIPKPTRPFPITGALLLCLSSLVFALVSCLFSVADLYAGNGRTKLEEGIRKAPNDLAGELSTETLINIGVTTAIGLAVLFAALNIVVTLIIAYLIIKGRKFVRTLMVVFSTLGAINFFLSGISWVSLGSYAILLTMTTLIWLPSSATHFHVRAYTRPKPDAVEPEPLPKTA